MAKWQIIHLARCFERMGHKTKIKNLYYDVLTSPTYENAVTLTTTMPNNDTWNFVEFFLILKPIEALKHQLQLLNLVTDRPTL
jgi:hypothetical protein